MLLTPELLFTITVLIVAGYLLWAVPKKITAIFFLPLMLVSYVASLDLLGWPVPYWAEWRVYEKGIYISHVLKEPETVYVWADVGGAPRAYSFPWSLELAKTMERAGKMKEEGTEILLEFKPFKRSMEDRLEEHFYEAPQPAYPPKAP